MYLNRRDIGIVSRAENNGKRKKRTTVDSELTSRRGMGDLHLDRSMLQTHYRSEDSHRGPFKASDRNPSSSDLKCRPGGQRWQRHCGGIRPAADTAHRCMPTTLSAVSSPGLIVGLLPLLVQSGHWWAPDIQLIEDRSLMLARKQKGKHFGSWSLNWILNSPNPGVLGNVLPGFTGVLLLTSYLSRR